MKNKLNLGIIYFALPLIFFSFIKLYGNQDIWFLFSHGKYILHNGFPHTEFLTIHQGLHFVMQQWGFSFIIYILYYYTKLIGVVVFVGILNFLILCFIFKLCFRISNNKYFSFLVASILDLLLELNFVIIRPQMVSLLILLITVYILERKDKTLYLLPILSIILVNFHASMWLLLFIVCLPFLAEYILKKDKYTFKMILVMVISFFVGFLNPYGLELMTYSLSSYGIDSINKLVGEMFHCSLVGEKFVVYNSILFFVLFFIALIMIAFNYKKISIHSIFMILGFAIMAFLNIRNISLFIVCAMPYVIYLFKNDINYEIEFKHFVIVIMLVFSVFVYRGYIGKYELYSGNLDKIVKYLDKNCNKKKAIIYTDYDNGSYLEYNGYKVYIDTRTEIFIKKNNHKSDILDEYLTVVNGKINYEKFISKYQFTHFITIKKTHIYDYLVVNPKYKKVYSVEDLAIFELNT